MIPKLAIEKAIEGGWKIQGLITDASKLDAESIKSLHQYIEREVIWEEIALDPTFWQALVKQIELNDYRYHGEAFNLAHRFYDLVLNGKDTTDYWTEILK